MTVPPAVWVSCISVPLAVVVVDRVVPVPAGLAGTLSSASQKFPPMSAAELWRYSFVATGDYPNTTSMVNAMASFAASPIPVKSPYMNRFPAVIVAASNSPALVTVPEPDAV